MELLKNIKLTDKDGLRLMSVEMCLMKNLLDIGIVEKDSTDELYSQFITPDNNYIVNLKRKPRLSFLQEDSESMYNCEIEFTTNLGSPILSIQTTEIEISKMIDSFYNLVELNIGSNEINYCFKPNTSNCISRIIRLSVVENYYDSFNVPYTRISDNKYNLTILDTHITPGYKGHTGIVRVSTTMNYGNMFEFLEKIYYTFLIDISHH